MQRPAAFHPSCALPGTESEALHQPSFFWRLVPLLLVRACFGASSSCRLPACIAGLWASESVAKSDHSEPKQFCSTERPITCLRGMCCCPERLLNLLCSPRRPCGNRAVSLLVQAGGTMAWLHCASVQCLMVVPAASAEGARGGMFVSMLTLCRQCLCSASQCLGHSQHCRHRVWLDGGWDTDSACFIRHERD